MSLRVFVADDDSGIRRMLRKIIEGTDNMLCVGEASDGEEAVHRCPELRPDVILIDVDMPIMSGVQAARQIKTCLPDVVIVFIVTHSEYAQKTTQAHKSLDLFADAYLIKPIKTDNVRQMLRRIHKTKFTGENRRGGNYMSNNRNNNNPHRDNTGEMMSWVIVVIFILAFPPLGLLLLWLKLRNDDRRSRSSERQSKPYFSETVDSVFYEGAFNDAARDVEDAVREVRTEAANVIKEVKSELSDVFSVFKSDEPGQSAKRQNADSKREQEQQNQTQRTRTQYAQAQHTQQAQQHRTQRRKSYGNSTVKGGPSRVLSVVLLVIAIIQMAFGARAIFNAVGSFFGDGGGLTELFLGAFYVLGGVICLGASFWLVQRIRRFKTLHTLISTQGIVDISELAKVSGASKRSVIRDVETMINKGYFGNNAYIDKGLNCIILSEAAAQAARNYADTPGPQNPENQFMAIIVELRELNLAIADVNISKKVDRIEELTAKIFRIVEGDPSKRPRIDRFLSYYLPTTQKLLRSYATFEKQGVKGENILAAKDNIGNTLDALIKGYELQLDQLFESDAMDIAAEISVLENLMKQDGLSEK